MLNVREGVASAGVQHDVTSELHDDGDPSRERLYRQVLGFVTATGAVWRIVMLISKWSVPLQFGDAWYYSIQATNNAGGRWFKEAGGAVQDWGVLPGAEHPPLTSVLITPASLLSQPQFWQRATMTVLGIAVVPLVATVGRRLGGRRLGVIVAVIAAVYPNVWLSDSLVMSETVLLLLVVLLLLLALRYRKVFDLRSAALLGVLVGIAGHGRSELLGYAPLFALIGLRSFPVREWAKRAAVVLVATGVTIVPWIAYNTARFDAVVLMSTNEGNTWLGANCPLTYGGPGLGGWNLLCLDDGPARAGEDTAERSIRRRHEAVSFARAHASRLPIVVAARVLRAADLYGLDENVRADLGEERPRWAIWAGMISWWILAPMALVGLVRTRRGNRYIVCVPVIGVVLVTIAFYGSHRLRAPLEPVVVLGAGAFIAALSRVNRAIDTLLGRFNHTT